MRKAMLVSAAALCLLSPPAAAQLMNSFHLVPVIVKAPGLGGTFWQSDLSISNLSPTAVTVGAKYFPSDVANTFNGTFPKSVSIGAGQTLLVQDVLGTWFPSAGNGKGFLVLADTTPVNCNVSKPPTAYSGLLAVTSRTYNTGDPKGTYSTAVDPNLTGANWTTYPSVIPGVRHTGTTAPGYRTNLSVANFSTGVIVVFIRIFNSAGALLYEGGHGIEALSFRQWTLGDFGVSNLGAGAGRIEVSLQSSLVPDPCASPAEAFCSNPCDPQKCPTKYAMRTQPTFYAYASTIDNGTGDGTVVSPLIDWQGWNKYVGDYTKGHCPSVRAYRNNLLSDAFRASGLVEPDPPPTFRKVGR